MKLATVEHGEHHVISAAELARIGDELGDGYRVFVYSAAILGCASARWPAVSQPRFYLVKELSRVRDSNPLPAVYKNSPPRRPPPGLLAEDVG